MIHISVVAIFTILLLGIIAHAQPPANPTPLWLHLPNTPTPIQIDREYETVLRQGG